MKGNFVSVFVCFAIFELSVSGVFDLKSEAKKEIEVKYNEILTLGSTIQNSANDEKKSITNKGEEDLKKYISVKVNETKIEFEKDASAIIRTAIVQAKPVAVIYCIRGVLFTGNDRIIDAHNENQKKMFQVKIKKLEKIDFDVYAIKAILTGIKELVEQAKKNIDEGHGDIQTVKNEALLRCESAILLLGEIELCLHEPILSTEYTRLRQEVDRNLRVMKMNLNSELKGCLNKSLHYWLNN